MIIMRHIVVENSDAIPMGNVNNADHHYDSDDRRQDYYCQSGQPKQQQIKQFDIETSHTCKFLVKTDCEELVIKTETPTKIMAVSNPASIQRSSLDTIRMLPKR